MFLHDVPLDLARERFAGALRAGRARVLTAQTLALDDALDRVTARSVIARLSSPHYHACAMDGIAVVAARTAGARETAPLTSPVLVPLALGLAEHSKPRCLPQSFPFNRREPAEWLRSMAGIKQSVPLKQKAAPSAFGCFVACFPSKQRQTKRLRCFAALLANF